MHPSSASADFTGTAILRLCFGRAVFVCHALFLLDWGARLRRSVGCPEGARQTRVSNRCSSIAWAAGPPQRCTPVQQALIYPVSQTWQFCFGRTAFLLLFFLLNWEARRPERQAGPCASLVPPTTKNPQTEWPGDHGGAFSTAVEHEPFIPDTVADSTNHGEYGESPRFWHSR